MSRITTINGLNRFPNLADFRADYNALTELDLKGCNALTYVDVSDCQDSDGNTSLQSIDVAGLTGLQQLRIDDSDFSVNGLGSIAGLSDLESLTWLDLDGCGLTGEVDLSVLPALTGFDLTDNSLTSIIISSSQPITSVNASGLALTEQAVDALLQALDANGQTNGTCSIDGGTNAMPGQDGMAAIMSLNSKGWITSYN